MEVFTDDFNSLISECFMLCHLLYNRLHNCLFFLFLLFEYFSQQLENLENFLGLGLRDRNHVHLQYITSSYYLYITLIIFSCSRYSCALKQHLSISLVFLSACSSLEEDILQQ